VGGVFIHDDGHLLPGDLFIRPERAVGYPVTMLFWLAQMTGS
jgi:hypothetical protein